MSSWFVWTLLCVPSALIINSELTNFTQVEEVRVVAGYEASLPCRVRAPHGGSPTITLWYSSHRQTPVYSYDERPANTTHWVDAAVFGTRVWYHADWTPPALQLMAARSDDAGLYRCRVDYQRSNSRQAWVQLHVIVPPERVDIIVRDSPVLLGQRNDVICRAVGGDPPPRVVWLQHDVVVDSNYTVTEDGGSFNSLEVPATRADLVTPFLCRAVNNDLARPDDGRYLRNVTSGPLTVRIAASEIPLSEGRPTQLRCTVVGSNPPSVVTWYQAGVASTALDAKVVQLPNVTHSVLTMNVTRTDHGRELRCRARNPLLEGVTDASYTLDVAYKPDVTLSLGRNLDASNLREGNDVFFVCSVDANPPPYKVTWYHEDIALSQDKPGGVLVSESTLVLQQVSRAAAGRYTCAASNVEGDTRSNVVEVAIRYSPMCAVPPSLRGVALKESVNISCRVDADPPDVTFYWTFNNSVRREQTEVLQPHRYSIHKLESVFVYSPMSDRDYGTLLCYAANSVGKQEVPCSFTVISAGPPEEVTRCSAENITSHSCSVLCSPGFNGGLPQKFLLQIWDAKAGVQVVNVSESWPEFVIRGLSPGQNYSASVTAYNNRGRAPPVTVPIITVNEAQMHKSLPSRKPPSPITLVLGIICGALLVVGVLLLAMWAMRGRCRHSHAPNPEPTGGNQGARGRVVGAGGLAMSRGMKGGKMMEDSDIQRMEKDEDSFTRRQPDPDLLESGTSLGSLTQRSSSGSPSPRLSSRLQDTLLGGSHRQISGIRQLLGGYDDMSSASELSGGDRSTRSRRSVGDIMSGGDLVRRPGSGDLLRSRELLTVDELALMGSTTSRVVDVFPSGNTSSYRMPASLIGLQDPPSPAREDTSVRLRGNDLDFDICLERDMGDYVTLGGSPRMKQHLISGRDSIL